MRMNALPIAAFLAASTLSCAGGGQQVPVAFAPTAGGVVPAEYAPTGEISVNQSGATFDDWRVVGPRVNLTRDAEGTWTGSLLGVNMALKPTAPGKLYGSGADLNFLRWGEFVMIQGMLGGRQVQFRFQPGPGYAVQGGILCNATPRSIDCTQGAANQTSNMLLRGQAASAQPPMPQFGLALIAALL
jgi:hypothetical protein